MLWTTSRRLAAMGVAGSLAACPQVRDPITTAPAGPIASSALFEDLDRELIASGAGPFMPIADGYLAEGDRVGGFIDLAPGACLLVYGRGSRGVRDLDLFVFADDGSVIASDEGGSSDPAIIACAPLPTRAYAAVRVASGSGRVAVGAHVVPPAKAGAVARVAQARIPGVESGRLESWPGLEERLFSHRKKLGSTWDDVRRFATEVDPRAPTLSTVVVDPGTCIDVFAVPSDDVPAFDLAAESSDGRVLVRSEADGRDRMFVLCSEVGESVNVSLRPRGAGGQVALIIGRSPVGASSEIDAEALIRRTTAAGTPDEARLAFAKVIGGTWGDPSPVGKGIAKSSSRTTLALELPEGCSRIDVHAGLPLGSFAASLWTEDGTLLAESTGGLRSTLLACRETRQKVRLDVGATGKEGPFMAERRTVVAPTAVAKHSLAASRIFERLVGVDEVTPSELGTFAAVALPPSKRAEMTVEIAAGECVEPILALDGSTGGFDLRLVDDNTGRDVLSRGRFVASQRLCAQVATRARLEIIPDAGPHAGLVYVHRR